MSLRLSNNVTAFATHANLVTHDTRLSNSIKKLSSGQRINKAADDAAGLTISEKLKTQIRGISRAQLNVQDGISLIQTAEGALSETHSILQRMRELAIQSSNDTMTTLDRIEIQKEISQLKYEIDNIAKNTEFNTRKLLDGTATATIETSDPENLKGVPCDTVLTFSDFSVAVMIKQDVIPGLGYKSYDGRQEVQHSAIFKTLEGDIASPNTTLASIANFYDDNGQFILELPQTLYLQGDGNQDSCVISHDITLAQLAQRIQDMATEDQLGNGLHFEDSTAEYDYNGDFGGQIVVTSGRVGTVGRLNFTGSEELVQALAFDDVIPAEDPVFSIAVTNIGVDYTERKTVTTQIASNRASGLIQGIDLVFEPPKASRVESDKSYVGVTIENDITFNLNDSLTPTYGGLGTAGITISVNAGVYSMEQVAEIINAQIIDGYSPDAPLIKCSVNEDSFLEFTSSNTGSAAWVSIKDTTPIALNELGISDGIYRGEGGDSSYCYSTSMIKDFDYSGSPVSFQIKDMHGNTSTVTLDSDYSVLGLKAVVKEINKQISANTLDSTGNPSSMAVKVSEGRNGILNIVSDETGNSSGFEIIDNGNLNKLHIDVGQYFTNTVASPAQHYFEYNISASNYGFNVTGEFPKDDLVFTVADLEGTKMKVTIPAGEAGYEIDPGTGGLKTALSSGSSFVPVTEIITEINKQANISECKVHAEFDEVTKKIKFVSDVAGVDGKVTIKNSSSPLSANNIESVFDIEEGTYQNGIGQTNFVMEVKDTSLDFQIGPNEGNRIACEIGQMDLVGLGLDNLDLTSVESSTRAITAIDNAVKIVASERAKLGAIQNSMEYTANNLESSGVNMTNAQSRIADLDMASEIIEMNAAQMLQQVSNAMVAQANTTAQSVLSLLQ